MLDEPSTLVSADCEIRIPHDVSSNDQIHSKELMCRRGLLIKIEGSYWPDLTLPLLPPMLCPVAPVHGEARLSTSLPRCRHQLMWVSRSDHPAQHELNAVPVVKFVWMTLSNTV